MFTSLSLFRCLCVSMLLKIRIEIECRLHCIDIIAYYCTILLRCTVCTELHIALYTWIKCKSKSAYWRKDVRQGKLFQMCTHLLNFSVLSLGGNVNTRRMSKPDMGSIFDIKKSIKYSGHGKLLCELSKLSKWTAFNLIGY